MSMKLGPGEPLAGPWRVTRIRDLIRLLFDPDRTHDGRPWILAVDGPQLNQYERGCAGIGARVSCLRLREARNNADRRLPIFLRML